MKTTLRSAGLSAFAIGVALQFAPLPAAADPCTTSTPPFADVAATDFFCTNAEWLKNRAITLGCGPNVYCPANFVTRGEMAAFLNRLGNVVTPTLVRQEANPGAINPSTPTLVCTSPTIAAANYPRAALLDSTFSGLVDGALNYRHDLYYSENGAPFLPVWPNFNPRGGASAANVWVTSSLPAAFDMLAGATYAFAIQIQREGVSPTVFTSSRCFLTVATVSRTSTTTPFDETLLPNRDR
ncbi:MAG TPA: hypothetical protein VNE58_07075 [Casimicrobiaceae bacterium]|nr:hypothetical protein [Casimicrobiaceae bacterium]